MSENEKTMWMIRVNGFGTFQFEGTEVEAEVARARLAQRQRGTGMKWRKDLLRESDRLNADIAALFDQGKSVPMKLIKQRAKAYKFEKALAGK